MDSVGVMPPSNMWRSGQELRERQRAEKPAKMLRSVPVLSEAKSAEKPKPMWRYGQLVSESDIEKMGSFGPPLPKRGAKGVAFESKEQRAEEESDQAEIRSTLKNIELEETEKMKAKDKTREEDLLNPMAVEDIFSMSDSDSEPEPAWGCGKRKMKVRVSKEYIQFLNDYPPSPPYEPSRGGHPLSREIEAMAVAEEKAERLERERILQQYNDCGHAYMEIEVTDDEEWTGTARLPCLRVVWSSPSAVTGCVVPWVAYFWPGP